ncbi:hypothetical protein D9M68_784590 [compost metagenome]
MHLQRADAGGEVDHALQLTCFEAVQQGLHAHAQLQVQRERAELDQHVAVTGLADHAARAVALLRAVVEDGRALVGEGFDRLSPNGGGLSPTPSLPFALSLSKGIQAHHVFV